VTSCLTSFTNSDNFGDYQHKVNDPPFKITPTFEEDPVGLCGLTQVYRASLSNGDPLPAFITFDVATGALSVESQSIDDVGLHSIIVTGYLQEYGETQPDYVATYSCSIEVVDPCLFSEYIPIPIEDMHTFIDKQVPVQQKF